VNKVPVHTACDDQICPQPELCPLSQLRDGSLVRIKHLACDDNSAKRLREMGLGEEQKVKVLTRDNTVICQVCNMRLGISTRLADKILVEPEPESRVAPRAPQLSRKAA
jgi:Fe2+ transport system protein FeoA